MLAPTCFERVPDRKPGIPHSFSCNRKAAMPPRFCN